MDILTCPHCFQDGTLVHNGNKRGKPNYICNDCGRQTTKPIAGVSDGVPAEEIELTGEAETLEQFIESLEIDYDLYEIVSVKVGNGVWDVSSKKRDQSLKWTKEPGAKGFPVQLMEGHSKRGDWETIKNRSAKFTVTIRPRKDVFNIENAKKDMLETVALVAPYSARKVYEDQGPHCLEVNIFDLHFGKLAWAPESGQNYDYKIARERFFDSIEYFISMASNFKISEIAFPVGNDFLNSDTDYPYAATTKGTPQENDLRWQKMFKIGREMLIMAINRMSEIAPVRVIIIPGNHDFQKSFYIGEVLDVRYENDQNVYIDNDPKPRKYYKYGKNLIGFTHGNEEPESRLLMLMPQEVPGLWAKTKYREWHCGHLHHSKKVTTKASEDVQGISIRYMRSLKGTDEWENKKGYIGSIGGAEAYMWHKDKGLISSFNYNL